jgi:hypothetical protein
MKRKTLQQRVVDSERKIAQFQLGILKEYDRLGMTTPEAVDALTSMLKRVAERSLMRSRGERLKS